MTEPPSTSRQSLKTPYFIAVLVAVTAVAPFSMQLFIPALPIIQKDFGISQDTAMLSLSLSLMAIAVANFIYGPVSDRIGRKPTLLAGLLIFLVGCALAAVARDIWTLVAGRLLQGAGGAAGLVMARAMVRDVFGAEGAARAISYLTMAMVTAPMIAPIVGGLLTDAIHWRAVFVAVAVLLAPILMLTWVKLQETAPQVAAATPRDPVMTGIKRLIGHRRFVGYVACGSLSMGIFFAFLAAAPFLTVDVLQFSSADYGLLFITVSGAYISGAFLGTRLHPRLGEAGLVLWGSLGTLVTAALAALAYALTPLNLLTLFAPAVIISVFQGFIIPNAQAGALNVDARYAGTASGLTGFVQMGCAAVTAQIVADMADGTVWPMMTAIGVMSVAAMGAYMLIRGGAATDTTLASAAQGLEGIQPADTPGVRRP